MTMVFTSAPRGEMESRMKECQLDLVAGTMPAATMRANQVRLRVSAMAYVLISAPQRIALGGKRRLTAAIKRAFRRRGTGSRATVYRRHLRHAAAARLRPTT
jgi:hypothetical protein